MSFFGRVHSDDAAFSVSSPPGLGLFALLRPRLSSASAAPRLAGEHDRKADVVGVGLDDLAEPVRLEELVLVRLQMQDHRGAAPGPLGVVDA